jgi:hypothetical protein
MPTLYHTSISIGVHALYAPYSASCSPLVPSSPSPSVRDPHNSRDPAWPSTTSSAWRTCDAGCASSSSAGRCSARRGSGCVSGRCCSRGSRSTPPSAAARPRRRCRAGDLSVDRTVAPPFARDSVLPTVCRLPSALAGMRSVPVHPGRLGACWSPTGRELFHRDAAMELVATEVTTTPTFSTGRTTSRAAGGRRPR